MDKSDSGYKSLLLSNILDRCIGSKEIVNIRRKYVAISDYIDGTTETRIFTTGSKGEGFNLKGSDSDIMSILKSIMVLDSDFTIAPFMLNKHTILFKRKAKCQPGYVRLELDTDHEIPDVIRNACIRRHNTIFISSAIFRQCKVDDMTKAGLPCISNGPCVSVDNTQSPLKLGVDVAFAFPCLSWPVEATEWITRHRHGWPTPTLINSIVQNGCHLVPVGDKTSEDTFLLWRISFATAERQLMHSLSHVQFQVYGLLKYLLKQVESLLKSLFEEDSILCSYFLKIVVFYAVEASPPSLWQERRLFECFQFCLNILIDWVKAGHCPHYFIPTNNLFLRKVLGQNQQKLLSFLLDLWNMDRGCLSIGTYFKPTIEEVLQSLLKGEKGYLESKLDPEYLRDFHINTGIGPAEGGIQTSFLKRQLNRIATLLFNVKSETCEFKLYRALLTNLVWLATETYFLSDFSAGNKQKYTHLKRCKHFLARGASLTACPGKLDLATFFYLTGNYWQARDICEQVTSSFTLFTGLPVDEQEEEYYKDKYCGKGYTLYEKCKTFVTCMTLVNWFCPNELLVDVARSPLGVIEKIPPIPYAIFLTFLCYHHLGDTRRRDESLQRLQNVSICSTNQGGNRYWTGNFLLGICYQIVRDYHRAIKAFEDSLKVCQVGNASKERLAVAYLLMCYDNVKGI